MQVTCQRTKRCSGPLGASSALQLLEHAGRNGRICAQRSPPGPWRGLAIDFVGAQDADHAAKFLYVAGIMGSEFPDDRSKADIEQEGSALHQNRTKIEPGSLQGVTCRRKSIQPVTIQIVPSGLLDRTSGGKLASRGHGHQACEVGICRRSWSTRPEVRATWPNHRLQSFQEMVTVEPHGARISPLRPIDRGGDSGRDRRRNRRRSGRESPSPSCCRNHRHRRRHLQRATRR